MTAINSVSPAIADRPSLPADPLPLDRLGRVDTDAIGREITALAAQDPAAALARFNQAAPALTPVQTGELMRETGRFDEAEPLVRTAFDGVWRLVRSGRPEVSLDQALTVQANLALLRYQTGRFQESEALYRGSWEGAVRTFGRDSEHTEFYARNLRQVLRALGRMDEAPRNKFDKASH